MFSHLEYLIKKVELTQPKEEVLWLLLGLFGKKIIMENLLLIGYEKRHK